MGVNHVGARGPREHRKAPVLRGDQGNGAALVLDELRRRQVSRSAKARRVNDLGDAADDRLCHGDLFYRRPSVPPRNLGAERQKLVSIRDHDGAVDGGDARDGVDGVGQGVLPQAIVLFTRGLANELCELSERRGDGIGNGMHERFAPFHVLRRDDERQPAPAVARIDTAS